MNLADTMHRLAKAALDAGDAATPEAALAMLRSYQLHIRLGAGWGRTLAGEACFLTALATAKRAFLGGVFVSGDLEHALRVPLFAGETAAEAVKTLGGQVGAPAGVPVLSLGAAELGTHPPLRLRLDSNGWIAAVRPAEGEDFAPTEHDNPLAGVAAAALGVNEAFLHVRDESPEAGQRTVGLSLWDPAAIEGWRLAPGPQVAFLPRALWLVGLGHLGQAYAWALGMLPYPAGHSSHLVLQDYEAATSSNSSTCLFLEERHVGQRKARVVGQRLERAGFRVDLVERAFSYPHRVLPGEPTTALFGVDNVEARRSLEAADFALVVEAGLGSGFRDFRTMRLHTFPGPRRPTQVWPAERAAEPVQIWGDSYEDLVAKGADRCGMTLLASKAVATPFVGALAAALVIAEVIRPLHGGGVHAQQDLDLKSLRHRTVTPLHQHAGLPTDYMATPR